MYSKEAIEYILSLQEALRLEKHLDSLEYHLVHDAFLLNTDRAVAIKEMYTDLGKSLIKERKSAQRLFSAKATRELLAI